MFDYGLAHMDKESMCADVDIENLAIQMMGNNNEAIDAAKIPAYCNFLASGVKALRDYSVEVPFQDPTKDNIIIWKPISLLSDYERIENKNRKTTTRIKMYYNKDMKPMLVNLFKSKYYLPEHSSCF